MSEENETLSPETEDFVQLVKTLSEENAKYSQNKIMYDTLQEYLKDSLVAPELADKVKSIIHQQEIAQSNTISARENRWNLLGLNLTEPILTYREQQDIINGLETQLTQKTAKIKSSIKNIPKLISSSNIKPPELTISDKVSLDLKNQLQEIQEKYLTNLIKKSDLLEEILKLRTVSLPEVCNSTIDEVGKRCRINELKMKVVHERMKILVFTENPIALDAYKEVLKDIKVQIEEYEKDIEELKLLHAKYQGVSCKEYDDILKSYLKYKALVDQRKKFNS